MPLPTPKLFLKNYLTPVFIETGSHRGDGIQHALDAGFVCVYSVDISPFAYGWCSHRFVEQRDKVALHLCDSREFLQTLLPKISCRCTFWIDAHWCGGNDEMGGQDGGTETDIPMLDELRVIADHGVKDHIILIDDVRLMGTDDYPPRKLVLNVLKGINPDYDISFHDSDDFASDILVAQIL